MARLGDNCRAIPRLAGYCPKPEPAINPILNLFLPHTWQKDLRDHRRRNAGLGSHDFHVHCRSCKANAGDWASVFKGSRLPPLNSRKKEALFAGFQ